MKSLKLINKIFICYFLITLFACANRSLGPQGGPKDITPPVPKKTIPFNGETNFHGNEITIFFDEFVSLDKPQEKVIISPPQVTPASIIANGKKVTVTLNDSLISNTCYSIDFTNSIQDINEKNTLNGYSIAFTTGGEAIDSMRISGTVLDAQTLNPLKNEIVGIYSDFSDSAFIKLKPIRIGRTDENGMFNIKNIKTGYYKVYALGDKNGNYLYDDPTEDVAFLDSPIVTTSNIITEADTLKSKSINGGDSIIFNKKTIFKPNDIVLKAFSMKSKKQSFIKAERKDSRCIKLYFNAPNIESPKLTPLDGNNPELLINSNVNNDTIIYWIADSESYNKDMLRFTLTYKKDNNGKEVMQTDTIKCYHKHISLKNKKHYNEDLRKTEELNIKSNVSSDIDLNKPILLDLEYPIRNFDFSKVHLQSSYNDTIWNDLEIKVEKKDKLGMSYFIPYKWNQNLKYRLKIDSAAITSIYGEQNNIFKSEFKVKPVESYATLRINLINYNEKARLQLLDEKDNVKIELPATKNGTEFDYINPGDYYLRLYIDENQNGKWDEGDYLMHKQPEPTYYFNNVLKLRANWEVEQDWDYKLIPQDKQKPNVLKELSKKNQK